MICWIKRGIADRAMPEKSADCGPRNSRVRTSISIGFRADVFGSAIYGICPDAVGNVNNNMNKRTNVLIELRLI